MTIKQITIDELKTKIANKEDMIIIDVRDEEDFEKAHIPNAIHLDKCDFCDFAKSTDKSKQLIIYCNTNNRSQTIAQRLIQKSFENVCCLKDGFKSTK